MTATPDNEMIKGSDTRVRDCHKFFNIKRVSTVTKIDDDKLYNNLNGKYNSLTSEEIQLIKDALKGPVTEFYRILGIQISFSPYEGTNGNAGAFDPADAI